MEGPAEFTVPSTLAELDATLLPAGGEAWEEVVERASPARV